MTTSTRGISWVTWSHRDPILPRSRWYHCSSLVAFLYRRSCMGLCSGAVWRLAEKQDTPLGGHEDCCGGGVVVVVGTTVDSWQLFPPKNGVSRWPGVLVDLSPLCARKIGFSKANPRRTRHLVSWGAAQCFTGIMTCRCEFPCEKGRLMNKLN